MPMLPILIVILVFILWILLAPKFENIGNFAEKIINRIKGDK